jgi:hypothetical protein
MNAYSPTLEGFGRSILGLSNVERIVRINEKVVIVVVSRGAMRVSAAGNGDGEESIGG